MSSADNRRARKPMLEPSPVGPVFTLDERIAIVQDGGGRSYATATALLESKARPRRANIRWWFGLEGLHAALTWKPAGLFLDLVLPEVFVWPILPTVSLQTPTVLEGQRIPPGAPIAHVHFDEESIGALAARHLIQQGLKNFAFMHYHIINSVIDPAFSEGRRDGFAGALASEGFACQVLDMAPCSGVEKLPYFEKQIESWLRQLPKPVGVFAADDYYASEILQACDRCGLAVPAEVAVVGANEDRLLCQAGSTSMSSVILPHESLATCAWEMLHKLMRGERPAQQTTRMAASRIAVRASTESRGNADPDVARAMNFIRRNVRIKLTVAHVVDDALISRRTLESKFRTFLDKTILQQIQMERVEWFKELLADTERKISAVARRAGFNDLGHFSTFFKEYTGMTPTEYRASLDADQIASANLRGRAES